MRRLNSLNPPFSTSFACILQHEGHNCFSFFHRIRLYSLQCISSLTNEKKWDKLLDSTSQLYVCFLHYTVYTTRLPVFWKNYNLWTPDNILLRILNKTNFPINPHNTIIRLFSISSPYLYLYIWQKTRNTSYLEYCHTWCLNNNISQNKYLWKTWIGRW